MRRIIFAGTDHCSAALFASRRRSRHGSCGKGAARGHGGKDLKHPGRGVGGVTNTFCVFYTVRHWSRRQSAAGKAEKTNAWEQKRPSPRQNNTVTAGTFKRLLKTSRFLTAFFAERDGPAPISRPTRRVHRHARTAFRRNAPPPRHDAHAARRNPHGRNAPGCFSGPEPRSAPHTSGRTENEWKNRGIRAE